jgi:hypothetical protein
VTVATTITATETPTADIFMSLITYMPTTTALVVGTATPHPQRLLGGANE